MKLSGHMSFDLYSMKMTTDFRSDESFPVKTGNCRRGTVDPSLEPEYPSLPEKMTLFFPSDVNFRFYRRKTGSYLKVVDGPLIRRRIIDFLMKILGTIPLKCLLPVLLSKNR